METVGRENMPEGGVSTREAPRRENQSLGAPGVAAETGLSETGPRPRPARSAARRLSGLGARPHPCHKPRSSPWFASSSYPALCWLSHLPGPEPSDKAAREGLFWCPLYR